MNFAMRSSRLHLNKYRILCYTDCMKNDLTGQRFGRLVAVEPSGRKKWGCIAWNCICDCGTITELASNTLKSGLTKSCGCLLSETARAASTKHGRYGSGEYKSWDSMIQRCTNPSSPSYARYGARGLTVCEDWLIFENFYRDMGPRPPGHTIDRLNNAEGYSASNCRWATPVEQAHNKNRRCTSFDEAQAVRKARFETGKGPKGLSQETGISEGSISGILYLDNISRPR